MMYKLLVAAPSGRQQIVFVEASGAYYDESAVMWDERVDGVMPDIELGKMQRVGDELITLESVLPEHAAAVRSEGVPSMVTMRQCELALIESGLFSQVETFIAIQPEVFKAYWRRSATVRRNHALVLSVQAELGKTDAQMDDLFIMAASYEA